MSIGYWSAPKGRRRALPAIGILLAIAVVLSALAIRVFRWDAV